VKTINLINEKEGRDRSDTGTGKANDRVEVITVSDDQNPSSHDSTRRSRSMAPDRRSTFKTFKKSDSLDNAERNYRSNDTKNDFKNDNKGQKLGNPSQTFCRSNRRYNVESRDRTYTNDRITSNNSTGHDFPSRNSYSQRRFSYFFILAESTIHASLFITMSDSEGEMMEQHISSLIILIHNMKREYQNIFFDFTTIKNFISQYNANDYGIL